MDQQGGWYIVPKRKRNPKIKDQVILNQKIEGDLVLKVVKLIKLKFKYQIR